MRRTQITIAAVAAVVLSAVAFSSGLNAQASAPNCTPDLATGSANGVLGGPAPVGTPYSCTNPVFPGALIKVDGSHGGNGGTCTANFVFSGSDGLNYLGTAGHCTLAKSNISGDAGEFQDAPGAGAVVKDRNNRVIGRVAYAIQKGQKDFALIRLGSGITFDKALPHWGAVSGINTSTPSGRTELRWVGNGDGVGNVLYARSGYATSISSPDYVAGIGVIAPGDSGGPVIDALGRAIGVNVAIGLSVTPPGAQIITRLAPQLARATAFTGIGYSLA